ncbi:MAG TPA: DUF4279 domain-containing protein [Syntrophaceticus sp.]|jgi:hypothetical protein|uniref:DUF4279 domain-containing protein n=1 Tax=Syntrophaceticus schinkii TaxID=499207 RepID=A0A0B7MNV3_9FIRM|nr:DUF4279 domain-containing protein [Syntrophaceticus schinkii]MDD4262788.1 DUF4279 domain-containing protein [Syntrophaceticus schinkii]MDD4674632.1 DUF4279 domain-containing protein [Syntrophaceticus schinkii]CEO89651.1 conserved hypothetical protein [Syntrophaceticus schinkii]HHY30004.1 DUF4279 domain-containing protein [Syntrophaceticus sp.]
MKNQEQKPHDYFSVSFRIIGNNLEPPKITLLLGLEPDIAHKKGDSRTGESKSGKIITYAPFNIGIWSINSKLDKNNRLEDHIINILERIESKKDVLVKLTNEGFKMDFYCGYFFSTKDQAGISINNKLLKRIAELGIDLGINLYVT